MNENNIKILMGKRKALRARSTIAEKVLWGYLRCKNFHGYKFYRQFSIGFFILDFYNHQKKLGIGLDGNTHLIKKVIDNDKSKETFLNTKGIRILRFYNYEVQSDITKVLNTIKKELELNSPNPS